MFKNYLCLINLILIYCNFAYGGHEESVMKVRKLVKLWSQKLGAELYKLSSTMTRKEFVMESFEPLETKISKENGGQILQDIAQEIRNVMNRKENAVKRISEYAEYLSYYQDDLDETTIRNREESFNFFDADVINITDAKKQTEIELDNHIFESQCEWWCKQKLQDDIKSNIFSKPEIKKLFKDYHECDYDCDFINKRGKADEFYWKLPLIHDYRFNTSVNFNISVVKVAANIYERDPHVLRAIEMTEPLDMVFKDNFAKDKTLRYQYFASPLGFMRNYPGIQWSMEHFHQTYDPRTRSWYTEALTSPKDVIILLDRSGSMTGIKKGMAHLIVNTILDTLNDNDFVNVYTYANTTDPLEPCFNDTLVQANEENLRVLRENLVEYINEGIGILKYAIGNTTRVLKKFLPQGSRCNQIIMLITEMLESDFERKLFEEFNSPDNYPIRVFTYEVRTDGYTFGFLSNAKALRWIACANRGFYSNITTKAEVKEAVLNYTRVLSRPINYNYLERKMDGSRGGETVWSYLQIDLADRRYSNWLWKKFEGNRQRQVFIDHSKRQYQRTGAKLTSSGHTLLQEDHNYEKYQQIKWYDYMTTVSVPVFGRKQSEIELIGVAAVDVSIDLFKSKIMHHKLGVNGYAFILTNNGYVLMHPNHRREFEDIPKPTFNRVDFVEVEIMDDTTEPRQFNASTIIKLREDIINRNKASNGKTLKVKYTVDNMKRILHGKRTYFYTDVGPFNLGVALPDKYGLMVVKSERIRNRDQFNLLKRSLLTTKYWTVHPDWVFCKEKYENKERSPKIEVGNCLEISKSTDLLHSLLFDANYTRWFEKPTLVQKAMASSFGVSVIFLATHTGLTRWYNFTNTPNLFDEDDNYSTIEEDWYRRTVEENFSNEESDSFIYEAPFEISSYEENLITSTNAIFLNKSSSVRTPVAVIGLQFDRMTLLRLYTEVINNCGDIKCDVINCTSLDCYILDNNAYVVIADSADTDDKFDIEFTGRYFGDLRPDIMNNLIKHNVFKTTKMFDYQAICYNDPPEPSSGNRFTLKNFYANLLVLTKWFVNTFILLIQSVFVFAGDPDYVSIKKDTLTYQNLTLRETLPTPCDHKMTLFTLNDNFESSTHTNIICKFYGNWQYVVQRIPNSNLLFMALNTGCRQEHAPRNLDIQLPTPIVIEYNEELPCHIEQNNKYTRMSYIRCSNRSAEEDEAYYNSSERGQVTEGPHCGLNYGEFELY